MLILLRAFAIAVLILPCAAAQHAALPAPIADAIEISGAAPSRFAFTIELSLDGETMRARFDPGGAPRLRLVSPAQDQLRGELRSSYQRLSERLDGVPWCASPNIAQIANARLIRDDDETTVYVFQPTRESVTNAQTRQIVDHLRGELRVNKASRDIMAIRLFAPAPFSPAPLSRIESYVITTTCAIAPNGRAYASSVANDAQGSALGRAFRVHSVRRISDLSASP